MNVTNPTILIADDEPEILQMYKVKFERSGFTVLTACNGQEAIDVATASKPDLLLFDIKMSGIDGITAQKTIHENPETTNLKCVFLTAFSDPAAHTIESGLTHESGVLGIIRKGDDLNTLVETVRGYLSQI